MMSDIDKNIEILEEFKENGFASLMIKYNKNRIQTNTMVKMAIENMLSEFEGLREFSTETVRRNAELQVELEIYKKANDNLLVKNAELKIELKTLEQSNRNLLAKKSELETYKKIAEKLAEKCNMTKRATKIDSDNDWCNGTVYMTTEEKLDWARNEVKKDDTI